MDCTYPEKSNYDQNQGLSLLGIDPNSENIDVEKFSSPFSIDDFNVDVDTLPSKPKKDSSLFFRDGYRKIDYILIYKIDKSHKKESLRQKFEDNLIQEGLDLEKQQDGNMMFLKIHAPWEVLIKVAEIIPLKMPVKKCDIEPNKDWCLHCCRAFYPDPDLISDDPNFFMAEYSNEFHQMFLIDDKNSFFSNSQRSLIVHYLLLRTKYGDNELGIYNLIKMTVYDSAFPLHEGGWKCDQDICINGPYENERHLLYESWASPKNWAKLQPLDKIRNYFGEKIAIYFAWLGYYTYMLFFAAFVGIVVFVYSIITISMDVPSKEICDEGISGNIIMCPLCDKYCRFWRLNEICLYTQLTYVFDNYATVFYAAFIVIWATVFLEFWKRQEAIHQYDWDMFSIEDEETRVRPEYEAKVKRKRINPVTRVEEPYLPGYNKCARLAWSISIILFMICCVMAAMFGIIMYRIVTLGALYANQDTQIRFFSKFFVSASAAVICLIIILILNKIYENLAFRLTDIEYQRTDVQYETSFILKIFTFQFINYYGFIFYIAFFKSSVTRQAVCMKYPFSWQL